MLRLSSAAWLLVLLAACEKTRPATDVPAVPPSSGAAVAVVASSSSSVAAPSDAKESPSIPAATPAVDKPKTLTAASNAFAIDLWSTAAKQESGNLALSPASISLAFAMTYGAAKGETAAQMKKVFHFGEDPDALMTSWGAVARSLSDPQRRVKLRMANRLFGEKTYKFDPSYLDKTRAAFGVALEPVDFKNAPGPTRLKINTWVEKQTEQRIKDLVPVGAIHPQMRIVLVNALHFLGDWEHKFDVAMTRPMPFHTSASTKKDVPMMPQTEYFAAGQASGVKVLELPYKGGSASLLIVIPDKVDGLAAIEASLSVTVLESWQRALSPQSVDVSLPRFELKPNSVALRKNLQALGLTLPFDAEKADFTGMGTPADPQERIHIGDAIHKVFVRVDEKGTEAAAVTLVPGGFGGAPVTPFEVKVDHPFLFFIVDKSGLILFIGRVVDP